MQAEDSHHLAGQTQSPSSPYISPSNWVLLKVCFENYKWSLQAAEEAATALYVL